MYVYTYMYRHMYKNIIQKYKLDHFISLLKISQCLLFIYYFFSSIINTVFYFFKAHNII